MMMSCLAITHYKTVYQIRSHRHLIHSKRKRIVKVPCSQGIAPKKYQNEFSCAMLSLAKRQ